MIVKIPSKVKCGAYTYRLRLIKDLVITADRVGEYRPHDAEIVIDEAIHPQQKGVTLIHEYLHAVNTVHSLHLDDDTIDRLAQGFMEFLQCLGIELDWQNISP